MNMRQRCFGERYHEHFTGFLFEEDRAGKAACPDIRLVQQQSQLIISTHSPILMAYPNSTIYFLTPDGIEKRTLEETEHFIIMKEFLNNREKMLRELFDFDLT